MKVVLSTFYLVNLISVTKAAFPLEAPSDTPWNELRSLLSSPDILNEASVSAWKEECLQTYIVPGATGLEAVVSNYQLLNQSSGLCLDHLACVYDNCSWPFDPPGKSPFPGNVSPFVIPENFGNANLYPDIMNLPSMVLHPRHASDIVHAVEFCKRHSIGITVKVAGHSYFGASTAKNTLLVKMSTFYPSYGIDGSLKECDSVDLESTSAEGMACALAKAREKNAVIRVGGGELFDQAYRAVFFDWNRNPKNSRKYHFVGGGAGTVGSAGGWMASGGLSGTTGMRMYGIGVDQVLHIEMVLPDGNHVRFGPSKWEKSESSMYPKTKKVKGFCNSKAHEKDEKLWKWTKCKEKIDFEGLWFAVRGGGGGTYGVVTSLYYQLHDYFPLELVKISLETDFQDWNEQTAPPVAITYVNFLLKFLYSPSLLGVSESESRGCNSAQTVSLNPFVPGTLFCYNSSSTVLINKWKEIVSDPTFVESAAAAGIPDDTISAFGNLFSLVMEIPSYADLVVSDGTGNVPIGRLRDSPLAELVPMLSSFPQYVDSLHTHFPLDVIRNNLESISFDLALDALFFPSSNTMYAMGGAVEHSSDELNAISPTRRNAAFLKPVVDETFRDKYYSYFFGEADVNGPFPGTACHNHAYLYEMGPLKKNWTQTCPTEWPQSKRDIECISQGEAFWGTEHLKKLESIKASIDPSGLFICVAGVGYGEDPLPTKHPKSKENVDKKKKEPKKSDIESKQKDKGKKKDTKHLKQKENVDKKKKEPKKSDTESKQKDKGKKKDNGKKGLKGKQQ